MILLLDFERLKINKNILQEKKLKFYYFIRIKIIYLKF